MFYQIGVYSLLGFFVIVPIIFAIVAIYVVFKDFSDDFVELMMALLVALTAFSMILGICMLMASEIANTCL